MAKIKWTPESGRIVPELNRKDIREDKSEPDGYLYPASPFAPIELPEVAARALMAAG